MNRMQKLMAYYKVGPGYAINGEGAVAAYIQHLQDYLFAKATEYGQTEDYSQDLHHRVILGGYEIIAQKSRTAAGKWLACG